MEESEQGKNLVCRAASRHDDFEADRVTERYDGQETNGAREMPEREPQQRENNLCRWLTFLCGATRERSRRTETAVWTRPCTRIPWVTEHQLRGAESVRACDLATARGQVEIALVLRTQKANRAKPRPRQDKSLAVFLADAHLQAQWARSRMRPGGRVGWCWTYDVEDLRGFESTSPSLDVDTGWRVQAAGEGDEEGEDVGRLEETAASWPGEEHHARC